MFFIRYTSKTNGIVKNSDTFCDIMTVKAVTKMVLLCHIYNKIVSCEVFSSIFQITVISKLRKEIKSGRYSSAPWTTPSPESRVRGIRVSQVKPSDCFRLHPTSMISKHSTIPVPDSLCRCLGKKLVLPSILTQVFHPWCETCRIIQQQLWMKECDMFRGSKHTVIPPTRPLNPQDLCPWWSDLPVG